MAPCPGAAGGLARREYPRAVVLAGRAVAIHFGCRDGISRRFRNDTRDCRECGVRVDGLSPFGFGRCGTNAEAKYSGRRQHDHPHDLAPSWLLGA
jgi:hypothetical protein